MHDLSKVTQIKSNLGDVITTKTVIGSCGLVEEIIEISCPVNFLTHQWKKKFNDFKWAGELS